MDIFYNGEDLLDFDNHDIDDLDILGQGDDIDFFDSLSSDTCSHNISFGASEKTLEYDLRQAQKNIDYYEKEIRNFTSSTSETYKNNCLSHLEQAVKKANNITEELEKLQSK